MTKPTGSAATEGIAVMTAGYENGFMRALGLVVDMPRPNRPALRAVLLEDSLPANTTPTLTDIQVVTTFEVPTDDDERATQLKDLAETASARIRTLQPD